MHGTTMKIHVSVKKIMCLVPEHFVCEFSHKVAQKYNPVCM